MCRRDLSASPLAAPLLAQVADWTELARIGEYYATEDMVGPPFGSDTLEVTSTKAP